MITDASMYKHYLSMILKLKYNYCQKLTFDTVYLYDFSVLFNHTGGQDSSKGSPDK